jgi:hypothetical protein
MHPLDEKGKAPLNLEHGVFSVAGATGIGERLDAGEHGQKWETLKSAPQEGLNNGLVAATPPARVSKTVIEGESGVRVVSLNQDSSITYDPREHRFVNAENPASAARTRENEARSENEKSAPGSSAPASAVPERNPEIQSTARREAPPAATRNTVPPPAPRYSGGERGSSAGRSGGSTSSSSSAGHSSSAPATSSAHSSGHSH